MRFFLPLLCIRPSINAITAGGALASSDSALAAGSIEEFEVLSATSSVVRSDLGNGSMCHIRFGEEPQALTTSRTSGLNAMGRRR
jgi:hypothetical protein